MLLKPSERIQEIYHALQTLRGYSGNITDDVGFDALLKYLDEKETGTVKEINERK